MAFRVKMSGRLERMIITTSLLAFAFLLCCISTGTDQWILMQQTGKDPSIISLKAKQGLFERCVEKKFRSRLRSYNCFGLSDAYDGKKLQSWEKAIAGLMVTATIIMGLAVLFSGWLMLSDSPRTGILNDMVPVIFGNIAAFLVIIAVATYNSKFESLRTRLLGASLTTYTDEEADYGYSFYVGWMSAFVQFFAIFFFFVFPAFTKGNKENAKRRQQQFKMAKPRA